MKFYCAKCKIFIEDSGTKKEYNSSVYGPCFKYVVICPTCENEIDEYRISVSKKQSYNSSGHSCNGCCCQ